MAENRMSDSNTIIGFFSSEENAEAALRALHSAGFTDQQIGLAGHAEAETARTPSEVAEIEEAHNERKPSFWQRTRSLFSGEPPSATPTAASGSSFTGGTPVTPELAAFAYSTSDLHTSLAELQLPESRSRHFVDLLAREPEGVLITVIAGSRTEEAEEILKSFDADLGEERSLPATALETRVEPGAAESQRIQLYGEVLRVRREKLNRGEVRLRKETVTETKKVDVPVTHEELVIERTPVIGEKPAPGAEMGKEESEVRIPLTEERASVEKQPVVREEIRVGKRAVTDVEKHDETVRHEELKVENEEQSEPERLKKAS